MWIKVDAERVLHVHRGRDVILCDREFPSPQGGTLVIWLTSVAAARLVAEIGLVAGIKGD